MRSRPIGSIVGAVAGLAFVLINAGPLPGSLGFRIAGVIAAAVVGWLAVIRPPNVDQQPPGRGALRTYGISVGSMLLAIPIGATILNAVLGRPELVLCWVVLVVGAHFAPFARAFELPIFRWLAVALVVVALTGAAITLLLDVPAAAAGTGVAAGFVLLIFAAVGARLSPPPRLDTPA